MTSDVLTLPARPTVLGVVDDPAIGSGAGLASDGLFGARLLAARQPGTQLSPTWF